LYNPKSDGSDFLEIYNNKNKTFDLKDLRVANRDDGIVENAKAINDEGYLIFPQQFIAITTDSKNIRDSYYTPNPDWIIEIPSLPSYSDDTGNVVLIDAWETIIDEMAYSEDMQYALIKDLNGVSLERLDFNRASDDVSNWHSASSTVGYATPAYQNSQYNVSTSDGSELTINPEIFSPDNDAYNDILNIHYKMSSSGYTANISIYDTKGRLTKKLVQNSLLASEGVFTWDGLTDARQKANIGIYIIYFEAFNLVGDVIKIKKTCVLATKLNYNDYGNSIKHIFIAIIILWSCYSLNAGNDNYSVVPENRLWGNTGLTNSSIWSLNHNQAGFGF
jgi:hypothetical protein